MRIFVPDGREVFVDRRRDPCSQNLDQKAAGKGKHRTNQGAGEKTQDQAHGRLGGREYGSMDIRSIQ